MAYTGAGQLIEAWDYNRLTWGGNTTGTYTSTPSNLAYVWGIGNGPIGYGQDASVLTTVSAGGTVSATQWSSFVQRLNLCLAHQSGTAAQLASGSNIGITSGATIQYFSNVVTAVGTVNTNYASFNSTQGSTTTGANFAAAYTAAAGTATGEITVAQRTITFASANAARYFFNAGGQLNYRITSVSNNNGTTRSAAIADLLANQYKGTTAIQNTTNGGLTGTGGTVNTNTTNAGYRNFPVAPTYTIYQKVTSTYSSYSADFVNFYMGASGVTGSNGDNGAVLYFYLNVSSPGHSGFNDALNVTVNHQVDIVYPETTYLSGTAWGTPTIT
jgi:hypothetical protein